MSWEDKVAKAAEAVRTEDTERAYAQNISDAQYAAESRIGMRLEQMERSLQLLEDSMAQYDHANEELLAGLKSSALSVDELKRLRLQYATAVGLLAGNCRIHLNNLED